MTQVSGAPGSTVVPSYDSPADLAGKHSARSSTWVADVGIAYAISKPALGRRHLQASRVVTCIDRHSGTVLLIGSEHCPRCAGELVR